MRDLLQELIRRLKRDSTYTLDPALPSRAIWGLLWRRGLAFMRGSIHRLLHGGGWPVFLGRGTTISDPYLLHLGVGVTISDNVAIEALSRRGIRLGDNVAVGRFTTIKATGVLQALGEGMSIGHDSSIGEYCYIGAAGGVWIGNSVLLGQRVSFHSENHRFDDPDVNIKSQGVTRQGITVEDNCWVGSGALILDGVTIGKGAVVAAGAVVTHDVPSGSVVAGVPARVIRSRSERGESAN